MGINPKGTEAGAEVPGAEAPGVEAPREETLVLHGNVAGEPEAQIFYRQAGQGQPLVWLHWLWGEPGWMMHHQRLAERFHLYVPDLPGYGGSTLPEWASTPHDLAVLLLKFLDALSLQRPIVVGSCLGGWVGAELAILRPERLARLVLIDPLGLAQDWTQIPNIFYTDPARLPGYFLARTDSEQARAYLPDPARWSDSFLHNRNTSVRLVFDPYLHSRTLLRRLHLLATPTLVLWGEHDPLLGPEHAALWTSQIPQAHSVIIPAAGHLPYIEDCEAVIRAVQSFAMTENNGEEKER
jgi:pimeloyl-ACP methyl ester carboxylesterase